MKNPHFWFLTILLTGIMWQCSCPPDPEPEHRPESDLVLSHHAPSDKYEQIMINLWNNSPNQGNPVVRKAVIMELDELLLDESADGNMKAFEFYASQMEKVASEIDEEVIDGIRIWMMYNHGFVIKTSYNTFAFDLVDGYNGWQEMFDYQLPDVILKNIDVLFITHEHDHHYDESVINRLQHHGGLVINALDLHEMNINGLSVTTYDSPHSIANQIYEVITPDGYKIVHTGDNETSEALPQISNVDLLLLYAKTNESFTTYSSVGMRNCIHKLTPTITIPGHIHEFGHLPDERAKDNDVRALYKWSYHITKQWLPTSLQVMSWSEYYDYVK